MLGTIRLSNISSALAAVLLSLLAVTCGGSDDPSPSSQAPFETEREPAQQSSGEVVVIGSARWPTAFAQSLESMVSEYETVVVGVVVGATTDTTSLDTGPVQPTSDSSARPVSLPSPAVNIRSSYKVEVQRVLAGAELSPGSSLWVVQDGGFIDGVAYQLEDDPVIETGHTYLFFLREGTGEQFFGSPFGRFEVGASAILRPVDDAWSYLPAVKELTGFSVDEATTKLALALGQASSPAP